MSSIVIPAARTGIERSGSRTAVMRTDHTKPGGGGIDIVRGLEVLC